MPFSPHRFKRPGERAVAAGAARGGALRDHGGDLGAAIACYGGAPADWIDLSTGINWLPYPAPPPSERAVRALPDAERARRVRGGCARAYGAPETAACLPVAGARGDPALAQPALRRAAVLAPTYNEVAAAFAAAGWSVAEVGEPHALRGFDAAVVVNPNNPDGRRTPPETLWCSPEASGCWSPMRASPTSTRRLRSARTSAVSGLLVLRSFGKFFGSPACGSASSSATAEVELPPPPARGRSAARH